MPMFKVRGWEAMAKTRDGKVKWREPMTGVVTVEAKDGKAAAHQYAKVFDIPSDDWWDVGSSPLVVIRVSNPEDQDP